MWGEGLSPPLWPRHEGMSGIVSTRRHLARLEAYDDPEEQGKRMAGCLRHILSAAHWTRAELKAADLVQSGSCTRCGHHLEDRLHRLWLCPANRKGQLAALTEETEHLKTRAQQEFEQWGCLWGRSLPPKALYHMLKMSSTISIIGWGCLRPWAQLERVNIEGMVIGVDVSGIDSEAGDMRTYAVGSGVVSINPQLEVVGGAIDTVPGELSVPISELAVALLVALLCSGSFSVVSDCSYVAKGFDRLISDTFDFDLPKLKNADLWKWAKGSRPLPLQKALAHLTAQQWCKRFDGKHFDWWIANLLVDEVAKQVAALAMLPPWIRKDIDEEHQLVTNIQKRLAHIQAAVVYELAATGIKPNGCRGTTPIAMELARCCTDHRIQDVNGGLRCTACKDYQKFGPGCLLWLAQACPGQFGNSNDKRPLAKLAKNLADKGLLTHKAMNMAARLPPSHRIVGSLEWATALDGVQAVSTWWGCTDCGYSSSGQLRLLQLPCHGRPATAGSKHRKKLIMQGQRPAALKHLQVLK